MVEELAILLKDRTARREPSAWVNALNHQRNQFWKDAEKEFVLADVPLKPQRVVAELNKHLPADAIVISDAGTPTPYITRYLKLNGQGSRFIIPRSYGGLGYAIPAVVGAHFARPESRVVALFGDAVLGIQQENWKPYASEYPGRADPLQQQHLRMDQSAAASSQRGKYFSVDFNANDPAKVAEGFGLASMRIKTPEELIQGLGAAFAGDQPVFIDVATESEVESLPPVYSWMKAAETM